MVKNVIRYWDDTSFYLHKKVFYVGFGIAALFVLSFFVAVLQAVAFFLLIAILVLVVIDAFLLYRIRGLSARRVVPDRLSLGDENKVVLQVHNHYPFKIAVNIIDELPYQFQARRWRRKLLVDGGSIAELLYWLTPYERGEYHFGVTNGFVHGPLGVVSRRYRMGEAQTTKVYPSFFQMRKYSLLAATNRLQETGLKRIRRLGHSLEFEQIKEYVRGDDYRTINWKATARRGDLMANNFTDERSQQVYCLIDKGRAMKMPFNGMTLLDHAINAALVLAGVALQKQDKAGLICFSQQVDAFLPADKKPTQITLLMEALYKQRTAFLEPAWDTLFATVRHRVSQRSLLVLFTNFESFDSFNRVLPSVKRLAHYHLMIVVFFENTELTSIINAPVKTTEDIYIKTIAVKYWYEKLAIVRELRKHGIIAILSTPQNLTVSTLNKYLELKTRQLI